MTIFEKVKAGSPLAALLNAQDEVVWQAAESPASTAYRDYFSGKLNDLGAVKLCSNQAGLAMALLCSRLSISECLAYRVSACGLEEFQKRGIHVQYEELIPLVRSSKDESMVCPIEQFLADHEDEAVRWDFLTKKYKPETAVLP